MATMYPILALVSLKSVEWALKAVRYHLQLVSIWWKSIRSGHLKTGGLISHPRYIGFPFPMELKSACIFFERKTDPNKWISSGSSTVVNEVTDPQKKPGLTRWNLSESWPLFSYPSKQIQDGAAFSLPVDDRIYWMRILSFWTFLRPCRLSG